jgi:hypothetical protein
MKTIPIVLLGGLIGLSGCAAGKLVGKVPPIETDDFAIVHIARKAKWTGC